jgi:hypothetical protein
MLHNETHQIMTGIRHFCPVMRSQMKISGGFPFWKNVTQGFVDQYGKFHTREEAWLIAEREGQIRQVSSTSGTLYSEDLY